MLADVGASHGFDIVQEPHELGFRVLRPESGIVEQEVVRQRLMASAGCIRVLLQACRVVISVRVSLTQARIAPRSAITRAASPALAACMNPLQP